MQKVFGYDKEFLKQTDHVVRWIIFKLNYIQKVATIISPTSRDNRSRPDLLMSQIAQSPDLSKIEQKSLDSDSNLDKSSKSVSPNLNIDQQFVKVGALKPNRDSQFVFSLRVMPQQLHKQQSESTYNFNADIKQESSLTFERSSKPNLIPIKATLLKSQSNHKVSNLDQQETSTKNPQPFSEKQTPFRHKRVQSEDVSTPKAKAYKSDQKMVIRPSNKVIQDILKTPNNE